MAVQRYDGPRRRLTLAIFVCLVLPITSVQTQLVVDAHIYMQLVEAVHTIFNNTCVIFMYTVENPMQALSPYDAEQLMSVIVYISRLHVRTFAYAIKTFKSSIGDAYFNLKRPLFILINDSEDMKNQFSREIAPWISMAYINWVIFFSEDANIESFFSEIYVPLDSIFLVVQKMKNSDVYILTEVYKIDKERELIKNRFGSWSEDGGLSITRLGLYQRRSNLQGQLIRVASVEDPPLSTIERDASGNMTGIKGFFGTVIQILEENMNCTVVYTECDTWGTRLPNYSWTGVVGMLTRKEIDLAATELLMTADRMEAVEFTTPVFSTKCRIFIKRPYYTAVKWTAYSDPFYGGIWISLLVIMIISSAFILIALKVSPSRKMYDKEETDTSFADTFFHIFGAVCAQGHEAIVIDPIRMINLVVHITGVIILAAYSAALISFLAVKVFIMPFTTMEGLLNDGSYKFGVIKKSADYSFFETTADKMLQRMFVEILEAEEKLPSNYLEGLMNVCADERYGFMIMDNVFAILEHQVPCILEPLDVIMQTTMAMAVPMRSPFRGIINSNILMMRDSGVLQRVIATELVIQNTKMNDHWTSVEIVDVLPLLLLIIGGSVCGLVLLVLEKIQHSKFGKSVENSLKSKFITLRRSSAK